jgi:hypothetical protein
MASNSAGGSLIDPSIANLINSIPSQFPNEQQKKNEASNHYHHTDKLQKTDVFLTHDWGDDEEGRSNHARVSRVNKALKQRGLKTWFDEERMKGNIRDKMAEGIENTKCVVAFITEKYKNKVNSNNSADNCYFEFNYATLEKTGNNMIPVVMERRMKNTREWKGRLGAELGTHLYVDMVSDEEGTFEKKCDELVDMIKSIIGPTGASSQPSSPTHANPAPIGVKPAQKNVQSTHSQPSKVSATTSTSAEQKIKVNTQGKPLVSSIINSKAHEMVNSLVKPTAISGSGLSVLNTNKSPVITTSAPSLASSLNSQITALSNHSNSGATGAAGSNNSIYITFNTTSSGTSVSTGNNEASLRSKALDHSITTHAVTAGQGSTTASSSQPFSSFANSFSKSIQQTALNSHIASATGHHTNAFPFAVPSSGTASATTTAASSSSTDKKVCPWCSVKNEMSTTTCMVCKMPMDSITSQRPPASSTNAPNSSLPSKNCPMCHSKNYGLSKKCTICHAALEMTPAMKSAINNAILDANNDLDSSMNNKIAIKINIGGNALSANTSANPSATATAMSAVPRVSPRLSFQTGSLVINALKASSSQKVEKVPPDAGGLVPDAVVNSNAIGKTCHWCQSKNEIAARSCRICHNSI